MSDRSAAYLKILPDASTTLLSNAVCDDVWRLERPWHGYTLNPKA